MNKQKLSIIFLVLILAMLITSGLSTTAYAAEKPGSNRVIPGVEVKEGNISFDADSPMTKLTKESVWKDLLTEYRNVITGISGIAALTMIAVFIINLMKLASSSTNPSARTQATTGILWSGIATVGLGAVTLFVGFFYNAI